MRTYKTIGDLVQRHNILPTGKNPPKGMQLDGSIDERYLERVNYLHVESALNDYGGDDVRLTFTIDEKKSEIEVTGYQGTQKPTLDSMFEVTEVGVFGREVTEVGVFGREVTTEIVAQKVNEILNFQYAPNSSAYVVFSPTGARVYRNASTEEISTARAARIRNALSELFAGKEFGPHRTITQAVKDHRNLI